MQNIRNFFEKHRHILELQLIAGERGLSRTIHVPEAQRPGLALAGFLNAYAKKRIIVMGKVEVEYLSRLDEPTRLERIEGILTSQTPAVMLARNYQPPEELMRLTEEKGIPLFRTPQITMHFLNKLTLLLGEEFAPQETCHGSLVEVFGVGVLIKGDSAVGKSEAALGLIERGHRLISDDLVKVKKREAGYLEGFAPELSSHHMEIRGIGIINVAHLYGAVCVRASKSIDLIVELETWDDDHFYDRVGIEEKHCNILGVTLPYHLLPVRPGRDVVLLLETIALNHRLKAMGYHSAKEFREKLHQKLRS